MADKHRNYLGVMEVVKSHNSVCVAGADIILWRATDTLGISLPSRQLY